jgi:hypothetical protein
MTKRTIGPAGGRRFVVAVLLTAVLVAAPAKTALARGPGSSKNVYVTSIGVQCAGDVLSGQAEASGPAGRSFTLRVEQSSGGGLSSTSLSQTATIVAGQTSYPYRFDISTLNASSYAVQSDRPASKDSTTNTQSRVVSATECAPPPEVPEAPIALLLPLSGLLTLGLFGVVTRRRRRRDVVAA